MNSLICFATLLTLGAAVEHEFDYFDQQAWGNLAGFVCTTGSRQSPIRINTGNVRTDSSLKDLGLFNWNMERTGILENKGGHTVEFTHTSGTVSTSTHEGTYTLQQFHLHWGDVNSVGSEHIVDGWPDSAEIHFVHDRTDVPANAGNAAAVISVRAIADGDDDDDDDSECEDDVWDQLNILEVQEFESQTEAKVNFNDFLPDDLSYYYYEGSLTTPTCDEVVQWFLLQETIKIPNCILNQLRAVERNSVGAHLTFNYRNTQNLNGRTVAQHRPSLRFRS